MKLADLVRGESALKALCECRSLSAANSFRVAGVIRNAAPMIDDYHACEANLLKKFGEECEADPGRFTVSGKNIELYYRELKNLLDQDIMIAREKIEIPGDAVGFSPDDMEKIQKLFDLEVKA